jgi:hypothetical protein
MQREIRDYQFGRSNSVCQVREARGFVLGSSRYAKMTRQWPFLSDLNTHSALQKKLLVILGTAAFAQDYLHSPKGRVMEKAIHSAKRGAFQRDLRTTKSLKPGLRLTLERRLALICRMECELQRRSRRLMEDKEQLLERIEPGRSSPKVLKPFR